MHSTAGTDQGLGIRVWGLGIRGYGGFDSNEYAYLGVEGLRTSTRSLELKRRNGARAAVPPWGRQDQSGPARPFETNSGPAAGPEYCLVQISYAS